MSTATVSSPGVLLSDIESQNLLASHATGILSVAANGRIMDANTFLEDLLRYSREELKGRPLWKIFGSPHPAAAREAVNRLHQHGYMPSTDLPLESKDGLRFHFEFRRLGWLANDAELIECQFHDIEIAPQEKPDSSQEKYRCGRILEGAHFEALALREIERTRNGGRPLSLLGVGVDRFEDPHAGHDMLLNLLMRKFQQDGTCPLRASDIVGTGDATTFLVLLPEAPAKGALRVAERLRTAIADMRLPFRRGRARHITVSIGVVTTRTGRASYSSLRSRATSKQDHAKSSGGNRVQA